MPRDIISAEFFGGPWNGLEREIERTEIFYVPMWERLTAAVITEDPAPAVSPMPPEALYRMVGQSHRRMVYKYDCYNEEHLRNLGWRPECGQGICGPEPCSHTNRNRYNNWNDAVNIETAITLNDISDSLDSMILNSLLVPEDFYRENTGERRTDLPSTRELREAYSYSYSYSDAYRMNAARESADKEIAEWDKFVSEIKSKPRKGRNTK